MHIDFEDLICNMVAYRAYEIIASCLFIGGEEG
jgi:hypothetical protein